MECSGYQNELFRNGIYAIVCMQYAVVFDSVEKKYDSYVVFDGLSLSIDTGSVTTLFGPNGSGKTTIMNIISGFVQVDDGSVHVDHDISDRGYIFQNYRETLFPWETNFMNVGLPLRFRGFSQDEINKCTDELWNTFDITIPKSGYPYQLSGGQQQLLVFMRAIITNPKLLLIDEPFSALDYENNLKLRNMIQQYYVMHKPTIAMITHNIEEAVHLSSNICVLSKKPTQIIASIVNDQKYPREIDFMKSETFHCVKDQVLTAFQSVANI